MRVVNNTIVIMDLINHSGAEYFILSSTSLRGVILIGDKSRKDPVSSTLVKPGVSGAPTLKKGVSGVSCVTKLREASCY